MKKMRIRFNSPAVLAFAAVCFLAYALSLLTGGMTNTLLFSTYRSSLVNPLTYLRMIGHVFGHSSWQHLFGNMMYFLLLGPMLEEKYGTRALCEIIALTALVEAIVNAVFFPQVWLLGASGVVFAFILLSSVTRAEQGGIPLTFILIAVMYLGQEVVNGIFIQDNVSHLSHILGGLTGTVCGFLLADSRR